MFDTLHSYIKTLIFEATKVTKKMGALEFCTILYFSIILDSKFVPRMKYTYKSHC